MKKETIYRIWLRDPQLALKTKFKRELESGLNIYGKAVRMDVTYQDANGVYYSGPELVTEEMLVGRRYQINCWDYAVGIQFGDRIYDPETRSCVEGIPPFWFQPPLDRQLMARTNGDFMGTKTSTGNRRIRVEE